MPYDPEYLEVTNRTRGVPLRGVEHRAGDDGLQSSGGQNGNLPCALCYVATRVTVVMIPAKLSCPDNWTREYSGYLMTSHNHRSVYECVDKDPETVAGSSESSHCNTFFYHVEVGCTGECCPLYQDNGKELTCVVCTR